MCEPQSIDELADERLEPYRDLRRRRSKLPDDRFVAEGKLIVQRLLASPLTIESILVEEGKHRWADACTDRCPVFRVPKPLIREVAGFDFHRGVLATARRPPCGRVAELVAGATRHPMAGETGNPMLPQPAGPEDGVERKPAATLLFACGVSDKENLGSMIRSATAFGVTDIVYDRTTVDPYATRVLRVSMGTAFKQRFYFSEDVPADLRLLAEAGGYRTVATTLKPGARELAAWAKESSSPTAPVALLVGSEAEGLPENVEQLATDRVTIPMQRETDSLNVAVATGIVLYALEQWRR